MLRNFNMVCILSDVNKIDPNLTFRSSRTPSVCQYKHQSLLYIKSQGYMYQFYTTIECKMVTIISLGNTCTCIALGTPVSCHHSIQQGMVYKAKLKKTLFSRPRPLPFSRLTRYFVIFFLSIFNYINLKFHIGKHQNWL